MKGTRLVLIRHGHPQAYVDEIVAGPKGCTGLSEVGRRQVAALAERLGRTRELGDSPVLVSSELPRAIETAEAIAPVLDHPEFDRHCDLCEVHVGDEVDGMSFADFQEKYGTWMPNVFKQSAPGVETWAEFLARSGSRLLQLVEEHEGRTVVAACHGGIIDASFRVFGDVAMTRRLNAQPAFTSLTEWIFQQDEWRVVRYNDHAHLEGIAGPTR